MIFYILLKPYYDELCYDNCIRILATAVYLCREHGQRNINPYDREWQVRLIQIKGTLQKRSFFRRSIDKN